LIVCAGCGAAVRVESTPFVVLPPQPADHPVKTYWTQLPACPCEEIGIVSSEIRRKSTPIEEAIAALMQRAREMGGDAVVGLTEDERTSGAKVRGSRVVVSSHRILSGTVVRFREPACRE
jgi:uncharacterized protein YbjQ (UPF0145 family)